MSSVTGEQVQLSIFGESHGPAIGCVIDGLPAGIPVDLDAIYKDMARRAPRLEKDIPHILSGVLNGRTTGAPLAMEIANENTRSGDYGNVALVPRPSHSDYPAYVKYGGRNDVRGGGHFSGRLTAPLVFAGAIAKQYLAQQGVFVGAHIAKVGGVKDTLFDPNSIDKETLNCLGDSTFAVLNPEAEENMRAVIEAARLQQNSVGGSIECAAIGLPVGVGGNMFSTVESKLSALLFGIPAVKGVQFGLGFDFAGAFGAIVYMIGQKYIVGGMTSGAPLVLQVAIKPTPSIGQPQPSVNLQTMEPETLTIHGRHDPCIVPRAVPVVEAAVAFGLMDLLIQG